VAEFPECVSLPPPPKSDFFFLLLGTATTALEHDVLQLHHSAVPDAASQWLLCSAMAV